MKPLILLILLALINPSSQNDTAWVLAKEKNAIQVYTRAYTNSEIQEFKAITQTSKGIQLIENLIEDVEAYPDWKENIGDAKILEQLDQNNLIVWYVVKAPWPFTNRDMVAHMTKSVNEKGVITYSITNSSDYIKEKEDMIRIKEAEGNWQLTPMPNGEVKISYQFYADPAGSLPEWVINMFIVDAPFQMFESLLQQISDT